MVPESVARLYVRMIRAIIRRYRSHPQYDDMFSAVLVDVFEALARLPEERRDDAIGLVVKAARNGAASFLASPENDTRTHFRDSKKPVPERISLDDPEAWSEDWEYAGRLSLPKVADFAPVVIERLYRRWVREELRRRLSEADFAVLWTGATGGDLRRLAAANGKSRMWGYRRHREVLAVARARIRMEDR